MQAVTYKSFKSKRKFGVELEVEKNKTQPEIKKAIEAVSAVPVYVTGWSQSVDNNFWHVKYDSTCGPKGKGHDNGGWEVASFVGSGVKDLLAVQKTTDALRGLGCAINDNCGLHVHVNIADFTPEQVYIMAARWLQLEKMFCQASPPHRKENKYCRFLHQKKSKFKYGKSYTPTQLWDSIRPTSLNVHENAEKKVAFNLVSVAQSWHSEQHGGSYPIRKTVEFRFAEGTLEGTAVSNWVRLFVSFVNACVGKSMPEVINPTDSVEDFLINVGLQDSEAFTILSTGLHNTKKWILRRLFDFGNESVRAQAGDKLAEISF